MMLSALFAMTLLTNSNLADSAPKEFRGAWVATVDNIDWPTKRTLSTAEQKAELKRIVDVAAELKLNALVFQVRPSADALYASRLEPWSEYLTGTTGKAPNPAWDPLATIIELAHVKGIEVHAWFNPYRAWHPAAKSTPSEDHVVRARPEGVRDYGRFKWMDPSDPWVQQRTIDVMMDVARRYGVDGVHIDDYFYPYPIRENGKEVPFPDAANYAKYKAAGGRLSLNNWRRDHVDDFIERFYAQLKRETPYVKFGISPFGIWRPGVPEGIKAGVDQYDQLYADARKWLRKGWLDYFTPQLYWPIAQKPQAFTTLLDWWMSENPMGRQIVPGQYTSRVGVDGAWKPQEIIDQIAVTRKRGAAGTVHFSFKALLPERGKLNGELKSGLYKDSVMMPAMPWLTKAKPAAPKVTRWDKNLGRIDLAKSSGSAYWIYVLAKTSSGETRILGKSTVNEAFISIKAALTPEIDVQSIQVISADRAGVWSDPTPLSSTNRG
jgi:uncharacterized lipoprotein YddW (UPF0748 family)